MTRKMHFISGLPRSGSTLLAAILRQNPRFHAAMSGPLCTLFEGLLRSMSESHEYSLFLNEHQREKISRSMFEAFYAGIIEERVVFDTNRGWCAQLPAVAALWPESRMIACVRSPAWILDSFERRVQSAPLRRGKMFTAEAGANVYTRVEAMMKGGQVGPAIQGLRQAWSGEHADRLIVIRYESLTEEPQQVMARLYELLGEEPFGHDFESVSYDEPEFDERLGMPGMHTVSGRVKRSPRKTILPADLFSQHDRSFWDVPGQNPRGVTVL
jgi:sulfotransferase